MWEMGALPDEAMARCSENQILDSSMSSVFCDGLCDVCIFEYHVKTCYLQVSHVTREKEEYKGTNRITA